jgi:hypothetical protein
LEGPVMMMNWQSINRGQRKNLGFQIHDVWWMETWSSYDKIPTWGGERDRRGLGHVSDDYDLMTFFCDFWWRSSEAGESWIRTETAWLVSCKDRLMGEAF